MEPYQMPQMEEEIERLRKISDENQRKVNSGVFISRKTEKLRRDEVMQENTQGEEAEKRHGIVQGILFLAMAAMLLGQASGNEMVSQVFGQIGKTIEQISQKVEEQNWFSFGEMTE
ncbi:MAG: hypothetical protein SO016_13545 [Lachnospiraceae bacterium]|nr:hypothetical protein [Lachnospiraceae bacterium]